MLKRKMLILVLGFFHSTSKAMSGFATVGFIIRYCSILANMKILCGK